MIANAGEEFLRNLAPRPFVLRRDKDITGVSGTGIVAWGTRFPDGVCVTRWCATEVRQTCVWASQDDLMTIHSHDGNTKLVFLS